MPIDRPTRRPRPRAIGVTSACAVAEPLLITSTVGGRTAVMLCGAGLLLLLAVVASLALRASFAHQTQNRAAARRTLLLLRLVPWYPA